MGERRSGPGPTGVARGLGDLLGERRAHEIARLGARLEIAAGLEPPIGLNRGGHADAVLASAAPQRRRAVPGAQRAAADLLGEALCDARVEGPMVGTRHAVSVADFK